MALGRLRLVTLISYLFDGHSRAPSCRLIESTRTPIAFETAAPADFASPAQARSEISEPYIKDGDSTIAALRLLSAARRSFPTVGSQCHSTSHPLAYSRAFRARLSDTSVKRLRSTPAWAHRPSGDELRGASASFSVCSR